MTKSRLDRESEAYAAEIARIAGSSGTTTPNASLGALQLENYRFPFAGTRDALAASQEIQLQSVLGESMTLDVLFGPENDEDVTHYAMKRIACLDIVDTATGEVVQDLFLWPWGHGRAFQRATTNVVMHFTQHGADGTEHSGKAWLEDFAKAWDEAAPRLGFNRNHFLFTPDERGEPDDED